MYKKVLLGFIAALTVLLVLSSCTGIFQNGETTPTGISLYLTDRPAVEVDKLWVDINGIAYHYKMEDGTEETLTSDAATTVDLLSLAGTEVKFVDLSDIPLGATIVWIGFNIEDATVVVGENKYDVMISGERGANATETVNDRTYFKVMINEEVTSDLEFVFDFDAAQSLRYVRGRNEYKLIPVIGHWHRYRHQEHGLAVIKGKIVDSTGEPVKHAGIYLLDSNESTIVRATYSRSDGEFHLRGIKTGSYKLKVTTTLPDDDVVDLLNWVLINTAYSTDVTVSDVDEEIDLGNIEISF